MEDLAQANGANEVTPNAAAVEEPRGGVLTKNVFTDC